MTTGALRSLTLHAPPATPVKLRLPSGDLIDLGQPEIVHKPLDGEKIPSWPALLILHPMEEPK